ncbi:MAG: RNA polymerase factor sigma-54 [Candidimonas sp.]|jgi:RNA polymerase sigma-54 factor
MNELMQETRLGIHTTLSPRLQQSVKLLQMSALEFSAALQQALASNPFLESAEEPAQEDPQAAPLGAPPAGTSAGETVVLSDDASPTDSRDYPGQRLQAAQEIHAARASDGPTLAQHLYDALALSDADARLKLLAAFIIDAIDEDGYLRTPFDELTRPGDIQPPARDQEWEQALDIVQRLDAPGIGARAADECLRLQLAAMDRVDRRNRRLAMAIVQDHLKSFATHDDELLKRKLDCSGDELALAGDLIRSLDPKPGRRYSCVQAPYIIPDVTVRKCDVGWEVCVNRKAMPQARLHQQYAQMYRRAGEKGRTPMARELQEARWLVRSAEQRYTTIARVAHAIVSRQLRFFDYGDVALRPLMLKEIADQLSLHESTISRATANKYMLTPMGIYAFRHFFSRELATDLGGSCSARAVKSRIKSHILEEDPHRPLSDVALRQKLAKEGIMLARRTVAKYRSELRLACAEARRIA